MSNEARRVELPLPMRLRARSTWRLTQASQGVLERLTAVDLTLNFRVLALSGADPALHVAVEQAATGIVPVTIPGVIDIRTRGPLQGVLGNPTTRWMRTRRNSPTLPRHDHYAIERSERLLDIVLWVTGEPDDSADVEAWASVMGR